jgi:hypothetical protein
VRQEVAQPHLAIRKRPRTDRMAGKSRYCDDAAEGQTRIAGLDNSCISDARSTYSASYAPAGG